jgi:hypothetical protein
MSKSFRNRSERYFSDDYEIYSKNEKEYRAHKQEKRIQSALKSKNIHALYEDDYDEED